MGKSDEKSFGQNVCDIGRVELGLKHGGSDCGAVEESAEAEQDPWALTDLVDTSEKWSGKCANVLITKTTRLDREYIVSRYLHSTRRSERWNLHRVWRKGHRRAQVRARCKNARTSIS